MRKPEIFLDEEEYGKTLLANDLYLRGRLRLVSVNEKLAKQGIENFEVDWCIFRLNDPKKKKCNEDNKAFIAGVKFGCRGTLMRVEDYCKEERKKRG